MSGKTILIVDDDRDLLRGLNIRLKANGYKVVFAEDGLSAITEARKETPDLILLDIGLPAGDGFSVMERLSNLIDVSSIPIIVMSARDPALNKERALKAGAVAYFQKPADNYELLAAIGKHLKVSFKETSAGKDTEEPKHHDKVAHHYHFVKKTK